MADAFDENEISEARHAVLNKVVVVVQKGDVSLGEAIKAMKDWRSSSLINATEEKGARKAALRAHINRALSVSVVGLPRKASGGKKTGEGSDVPGSGARSKFRENVPGAKELSLPSIPVPVESIPLPGTTMDATHSTRTHTGLEPGPASCGKSKNSYEEPFILHDCSFMFWNEIRCMKYTSIPDALRQKYPIHRAKCSSRGQLRDGSTLGKYKGVRKVTLKTGKHFVAEQTSERQCKLLGTFDDEKTAAFAVACAKADSKRFTKRC